VRIIYIPIEKKRRLLESNLFNILMLLGSLQGFILALIFWRGEQFQKKSNAFLALLIFVVSLQNLSNSLIDMGWFDVQYLPLSFTLLIPVTLYYFVVYLVEPSHRFLKGHYIFLVPFLGQLVFRIFVFITYLIYPTWLDKVSDYYFIIANTLEIVAVFLCLFVLVKSIWKIDSFEKRLLSNFSTIEDRTLQWLKYTLFVCFGLWLLWAIPFSISLLKNEPTSFYPLWIGLSLMTYWFAYSIYIRKDVFEITRLKEEIPKEKNIDVLSENTEEHYKKLLHLMEVEKLYQMPTLNMSVLAEEMTLSKGYLSKIINQKEGKNFFDFVNTYRVIEAKEKIADPKFSHYSLLGIGLEVGFSSKSTFNAVFKKMTGMTPSAYKKTVLP